MCLEGQQLTEAEACPDLDSRVDQRRLSPLLSHQSRSLNQAAMGASWVIVLETETACLLSRIGMSTLSSLIDPLFRRGNFHLGVQPCRCFQKNLVVPQSGMARSAIQLALCSSREDRPSVRLCSLWADMCLVNGQCAPTAWMLLPATFRMMTGKHVRYFVFKNIRKNNFKKKVALLLCMVLLHKIQIVIQSQWAYGRSTEKYDKTIDFHTMVKELKPPSTYLIRPEHALEWWCRCIPWDVFKGH